MQITTINHQARFCEATYAQKDLSLCYDPLQKILVYKTEKELDEDFPIYWEIHASLSIEKFHQFEKPRSIYSLFRNLISENRCDFIAYIVKYVGSTFFEYCPEYEPTLLMRTMDQSKECNKYATFNCLLKLGTKTNCAARIPIRHIVGENNLNFASYAPYMVAVCTPLWVAVNAKYADKDQIYMAASLLRRRAVCFPENTLEGEKILQQAKKLAITANELLFLLGSIFDKKSLFFCGKDVVRLVLNTSTDLELEIPNTQLV